MEGTHTHMVLPSSVCFNHASRFLCCVVMQRSIAAYSVMSSLLYHNNIALRGGKKGLSISLSSVLSVRG